MANLTPGGKFVVIIFTNGQINLKEIKIRSGDEWDLQDVVQYEPDNPEGIYMVFTSLSEPLCTLCLLDSQPQKGICRNGLILRLTDLVSNHPTLTTLGGPK